MNSGARENRQWKLWLGFFLIVGVAVALRWWNLGAWDMWTDEVQTLWVSQSGEFKEGPMYRTAPVNFFVTGWFVQLVAADALGARMPAFLSGALTVALFFPLMKRWIGGRAALLGTAVLALSFWHVFWSQNARHFALQTLLLLGALHCFLLFWREGRKWALALCSALLLLAHFTHASSGFFAGALLVFVVADWALSGSESDGRERSLAGESAGREERADGRSGHRHLWALGGVGLPLAIYGPLYLWVASYLLQNKPAWNPPFNIVGSLVFYVSPLLALFAAAGAARLYRERDGLWLLLLLLSLLPPILAATAGAFTISSGAYALQALPAIAALTGVAADWLLGEGSWGPGRLAGAAMVAALLLTQVYWLAHYFVVWNGLKPRWSEAVGYVEERREPGEALLASEGDVAQYYAGRGRAEWIDRFTAATNGTDGGGASGAWFVTYVDGDQRQTPGFGAAAEFRSNVPESARVEAVFPLHYGAKNRTLVVYHETGESVSR